MIVERQMDEGRSEVVKVSVFHSKGIWASIEIGMWSMTRVCELFVVGGQWRGPRKKRAVHGE